MNTAELIDQGNHYRSQGEFEQALRCYATAFAADRNCASAFNNYGNVLREIGEPAAGIPFLIRAQQLDPSNITAKFNLAVSYLITGNYKQGWPAYESRWQYEHLAGTEPKFNQPRWQGQDLKGKTILVVGEQGHGDNIQFVRFIYNLHVLGATIKLQCTPGLIPLLSSSDIIQQVGNYQSDMGNFDYWVPIMSIPGILGITLENLPRPVSYIVANRQLTEQWRIRLGPKTKLRVGLSWSGRRDAWLNQHKGMPFDQALTLVKKNPQVEWYNLQIDATEDESLALADAGVKLFPGAIKSFNDTAALITNMDIVTSVDTAIAHLSGALGRPTWIMLQWFALDWRWLLDRDSSPWYATARLFRQPKHQDWPFVIDQVSKYMSWFKV